MQIAVKSFNEKGMEKFQNYLSTLRMNKETPIPLSYTLDKSLIMDIRGRATVDSKKILGTRLQAGVYFYEALSDVSQDAVSRRGVWAWLSLLYFDQLCPVFVPDFRGRKKVHDDSCYIPSEDWRKYYRHKLLGPYSLYKAHGNFAAALLTNPVHTVGDINETIASRQEFVQNAEMMKVVHRLYYDQNDNSVKRGATSKEGRKGSAHRLWAIKEQLDLTYDLFSMTCEEILAILPSEFDAWMEKSENK